MGAQFIHINREDALVTIINSSVCNFFGLLICEFAVLIRVAHAFIQVVGVNAVSAVAVHIKVIGFTIAGETRDDVFTCGIFVAVVLAGQTLITRCAKSVQVKNEKYSIVNITSPK